MKHLLKSYSCFLFMAIALIYSTLIIAQTQPKFGQINTQEVLMAMPEWSAAIAKLESLKTDQNEQLKKLQDDYQQKMQAYSQTKATLLPAVAIASEQELQNQRRNITTIYEKGMETLEDKELEFTQPVIKLALDAIAEVAIKEGFLYIFDSTKGLSVFNSEKSIDILPQVKAHLGIK